MSPMKTRGSRHLILATALDGTLLGGSEADRKQLAATFSGEKGFRVIFVTGRNLEDVRPVLADPLVPSPDYIVGDVGATAVSGADLEPVQPLQKKLDEAWPGEEAVLRALKPFPYLERQETPQQGRCAFYLAGEHLITPEMLEAVEAIAATEGAPVVPICAAIEAELARLEDDEKLEFLADMGLQEPGLNRLIRAGYSLLQLLTFFTAGPKEARAWTVRRGATAPEAAGVIHTDFQKGFIRAEIVGYEDFIALNGEQGAKEAGKWRLEGKEYVIQEGDVVHFRFNV